MGRRSEQKRSLNASGSDGLFDTVPFRLPGPDEIVASRIPPAGPHHTPRELTAAQREVFRETATRSRLAKARAMSGQGPQPLHEINTPLLNPLDLMPTQPCNGLRSLSLFSGGGGLDIGFEQAGYQHAASYEILPDAAATLVKARPDWEVHGGADGDVTKVDWKKWRHEADIVHGGPPCQPFSNAGRQKGHEDTRDMWPAMIECVKTVRPRAFIAENVPALGSAKFSDYVRTQIIEPLSPKYKIRMLTLRAQDFGVPQNRRRVIFVGFARAREARNFTAPDPTHVWGDAALDSNPDLQRCMGLREALGLPDIGFDTLSPTIRSPLTGPRHTTSILNSVAAARTFAKLEIWPNGVAPTRERARAFVADNGHFRLAVPDVAVIQGFPEDWPLVGATYMQLGQIGNAVPPPLAYAVASSVAAALA
jgi:DNA (cytosine-5)-methyltransferase 1